MTTMFDEVVAAGRQSRRDARRARADVYDRTVQTLLYWTTAGSRKAVLLAIANPHSAEATRDLCHRLYRDIQLIRDMRLIIQQVRQNHIRELRTLLTCECQLYRKQKASVEAQRDMNEFQRGLVP